MATQHVAPRRAFPGGEQYPRSHSAVRSVPDGAARDSAEQLAGLLGWFSVGLGVASLAAPRAMARMIGARGDHTDQALMRFVGLQELVCGYGILTRKHPTPWLWARVAGDVTHLSMLGTALASGPRNPDRMAAATAAVAAITAADTVNAIQLSRRHVDSGAPAEGGPVETHQTITVNKSPVEIYQYWHNFANLPRFMSHLRSVDVTGPKTSHWVARGPLGMDVSWDAETTEDRPGELIAWRSTGGRVDTAGSVRFRPAPGGRGTEVHVTMRYNPPGGVVGAWFAKLFGESPEQQVYDDLRHFKQVMETGEVVRSEGSFDGSRLTQRPAQPPHTPDAGKEQR